MEGAARGINAAYRMTLGELSASVLLEDEKTEEETGILDIGAWMYVLVCFTVWTVYVFYKIREGWYFSSLILR